MFEQIFLDREYELHLNISPRVIVDGGANVGYASIYFANRYPEASILAIEPEPENFATLVRNTSPYPQIKPLRAAIWPKTEILLVDNSDDAWAGFVVPASDAVPSRKRPFPTVNGVTMHQIAAMTGEGGIDILKLDVEGAEKEIFGTQDVSWVGMTKIIVVELHDRMVKGCSEALEKAILGRSFSRTVKGEHTVLIRDDN